MNLDVMTQVRAGSPLAGVGSLIHNTLTTVLMLSFMVGMPLTWFLLGTWIAA